jgi:hypothetical protein
MSEPGRDDARLRDAFKSGENPPRSAGCPDDELVWNAASGEADAETLGRVLDHVAVCSACSESWRMARAIDDESGKQRRSRVWMVAAIAAGVLLTMFVLPSILERGGIDSGDEFRVPGGVLLESTLDETTALSRDRAMLGWRGGPEGTVYTVEVVGADLEVLVRSGEQIESEFLIPAEALSGIPAGEKLYWRVEALLPDSTRVVSPVFIHELQ